MGKNTLTAPNSQARKLRLLDTLRAAPEGLTCTDIAQRIFMSTKQTNIYLRTMEADNLVHILHWNTDPGTMTAYWINGPGVSAQKPLPQTPSEAGIRYRTKIRKDPDALEIYTLKNRARQQIKTMKAWRRKTHLHSFIVPNRSAGTPP